MPQPAVCCIQLSRYFFNDAFISWVTVHMQSRVGYLLCLAALGAGCSGDGEVTDPGAVDRAGELRSRFSLQVPGPIPYPPENGFDSARVHLGQLLFFDPILSGERDVSCGTCHHPDFAFTDGRQFAAGVSGRGLGPNRVLSESAVSGQSISETPRNAPTVLNAAYAHDQSGRPSHLAPLFWDGRAVGLEGQALMPIAVRREMRGDAFPGTESEAFAVALDSITARLRNIPEYVDRFLSAFPDEAAALGAMPDEAIIDTSTLARAIAAYERELVTPNSAYDRFVSGDDTALTESQMDGLELFFSKGKCFLCHADPTFGSFGFLVTGVPTEGEGQTVIPGDDTGREEHTLSPTDRYGFRTPSLRNVELTSPYTHAGVFVTLEDVVRFYSAGARPRHPNIRDEDLEVALQTPLDLTDGEILALVAFLRALTGIDALDPALLTVPEAVPSGLVPVFGLGG